MADRTSVYNFLYSKFGDKWYPGFDYENMLTIENELKRSFDFVGSGVIDGWTVEKLTENRTDQLTLISSYLNNFSSDTAQRFVSLGLNFSSQNICAAGTTSNISLSGGAPNSLDGISLSVNDKVLVKSQTTSSQNGVYYVSTLGTGSNGTWTRDSILDSSTKYNSNFVVYVSGGSANTSTVWLGTISGTAFTLDTTSLYFDNAFKQCIKVLPGSGIVDSFAAKTEVNNYFRLTKSNEYYVWAESLIGTKKDEICKISCPFPPDSNYDLRNNVTYLASVSCGSTSLLYDFPTVNTIFYEDRKQNLSDLAGEFQESLRKSYLTHKHLGNTSSPTQINLSTSTVINCVNIYNSVSDLASTIFILKNIDDTDFVYSSTYGIPKVYLDSILLSDSDYVIDFESTPCKIYLKNSIESNKKLTITLSNVNQKSLFIIDTDGNKITGALSHSVYYRLTDGTLEYRNGSTTSVYKNFSWNRFQYLPGQVQISSVVKQENYYTLDPDSGTIVFSSVFPSISSYNAENVAVIVDSIGNEVTNVLDGSKLNIDASKISKGTLSQVKIQNLDHNSDFVFNAPAVFSPNKYLAQTPGRKFYYPENTLSDLQYNTNVISIYQSVNLNSFVYGTNDGMFQSDNTFKNIKNVSKYSSDYGFPSKVIDNILTPDETNHFQETFVLTNFGNIYKTSSFSKSWNIQKSPLDSNGAKIFVNDFYVSTDKIQTDVDVFEYYTYLYAATNSGLYTAKILENTAYENWEYSKVNEIKDIDGNILSAITNVNTVAEIVTENRDIVAGEQDLVLYDRSVYVGSNGLYAGTYKNIQEKFSGTVKGIAWVKSGANNVHKNNIIWWNNSTVYITHTAQYNDFESNKYWDLPFAINAGSYTSCVCATVENIALSGLSTIDGYTVSAGERVLVKNQTDAKQNGIYLAAAGAWSRATDLDSSSEIIYCKYTTVSNGNVNAGSAWFIRYQSSYILGTSDIVWDIYYAPVYNVSTTTYGVTPQIKTVIEKESNQLTKQYIVAHSEGLALITESGVYGELPSTKELIFDAPYMGNVNFVTSYNNSSSDGITIVSTTNGIYQNTDLLWESINNIADIDSQPWVRTENMILANDELAVFDINSNIVSNYNFYNNFQLVEFTSVQDFGEVFLYEREYKDFYIDPWNYSESNKPRVTVYINSIPSNIPYTTDNTVGLIRFINSVSLQYINNVKVSIARNNPYLSNVGQRNHNEILSVNKKSNIAVSKLFQDFSPSDIVLYLTSTITSSTDILLVTDGINEEIIYVDSVDNTKNPVEVTLNFARTNISNVTFISGSEVYSIKSGISPSIETDLYKIKSKLPYNLTSLNDLNTLQLALSLQDNISGVFDVLPSAPFAQSDTRGLKNIKLVSDFENNSVLDETNSEITFRTEFVPTEDITDPVTIYAIENFSKDGNGLLVATDKGIWEYNGKTWIQKSTLDNSKTINYLKKLFDDTFILGTEKGQWSRNSTGTWTQSNIFTQQQFSFDEGIWGNYNYSAYGKSDGFSFVKEISNTGSFVSDNANIDSSIEVYGLLKTNIIKIISNTQSYIDTMLLFTSDGIYSAIDSVNTSTFSPTMISREMLGSNKPSDIKYYKTGFRPLKTPKIPAAKLDPTSLFVLTDNGLLKINNWQWCYPDNTNNYEIETKYLDGIDCNCFVLSTSDSEDGIKPGKSKIFIGTDRGVYRSFDEGNNFYPAERFNNKFLVVNDLKIEATTYIDGLSTVSVNALIASTSDGIWYSIDDGDSWYQSGDQTTDGFAPVLFDSHPTDSVRFSDVLTAGNLLAQTFISRSSNDTIDKVSVFLDVDNTIIDTFYQNSLTGNIVRAYLYSVSGGLPNTLVATSTTTYSPSQIIGKEFINFEFNYSVTASTSLALVIAESLSSSCISVMRWKKSNTAYVNGKAISKYTGSWANLYNSADYDFYFKIHYTGIATPSDTNVAVGYYSGTNNWDQGNHLGTLSKDDGSLTLDSKFLVSVLIDDTTSMSNFSSSIFKTGLDNLLSEISNRTSRTVGATEYPFSAFDVWMLGDTTKEKTSKFTTIYSNVQSIINEIQSKGVSKNLQEGLNLCMNSLNQDSIIQMNLGTSSVDDVVNYLDSISALRLSNLQSIYDSNTLSNDWDGTSADITNSENASRFLLETWAKSYTPLLVVLTDNSDFESIDVENYIKYTSQFWSGSGFNILFISTNDSTSQAKYLPVIVNSNGQYYIAQSANDWSDIKDLLLHDGANEIFKGTWTRDIEFSDAKYISSLNTTFTQPSGSSCVVEFRFSTDRKKYSSWITLSSATPYSVKKFITNIQFRINLVEGWSGTDRILPSVNSLYYVETAPAIKYYFTDAYEVDGILDEYILAENISNNENITATWGICRGNSTNWDDYELVSASRDGIFSSRQKSIQFDTDGNRYIAFGESTSTSDYKTYFARNGSWFYDSNVVVYVNNIIVRNTYILDRKNGCVVFDKKLSKNDLVTIYVQNSKYFRIGLKIEKYVTGTNTINFGLQYTTLKNLNKYSEYNSVPTPQLLSNKVNLLAYGQVTNDSPSIQNQMYVSYNISSNANVSDQGSSTTWYINKGSGFVEINNTNGYPNYANRLSQRVSDLDSINNYFESGDIVKVEVQPYDGFKTGIIYSSDSFTLVNKNIPYVSDVQIKSTNPILNNSTVRASTLSAYYRFTDADNSSDQSLIKWYDLVSNTLLATGSSIGSSVLISGQAIYFTVVPYDGEYYGLLSESQIVNIL